MASIYSIKKNNGLTVYYGSIYINGNRVRKLLGHSKKVAETNLKQLEYELFFTSQLNPKKNESNLNKCVISFLKYLEQSGISEKYFNTIKNTLFLFQEYLKSKEYLSDVTSELAYDFFEIRKARKHSNVYGSKKIYLSPIAHSTIKKELSYLNRFYEYCIRNGWTASNPFKYLRLPKPILKTQRFFFTDKHLKLIFENAGKFSDFYAVMVHTGLRPTDTFKLAKKHISGRYLNIRMNKTGDMLNIPLSIEILSIIKPIYEGLKDDNDRLFPYFSSERQRRNSRKLIQRLFPVDFVRENNINLHTFRHTYAHTMLNKGVPKEVLQTLLGHRSIKTTEIYANWVRKEELEKWV